MDSASVSNNNGAEEQTKGAAGADLDVRTVFNDPDNFNVKHPLFNNWTLWFDNPSAKGMTSAKGGKDSWGEDLNKVVTFDSVEEFWGAKGMTSAKGGKDSWGEDLNKVVTFDSVEEFWGLYNNIIPPSDLPQKANYYLFKDGIKPAWEDPANAHGGKWAIQLPRDRSRGDIDKLWLHTMLAAIGETLEAPYDGSAPAVGVKETSNISVKKLPRTSLDTQQSAGTTSDPSPDKLLAVEAAHTSSHVQSRWLGPLLWA
ncbi:eukaryotic translation initiation factor 4e class i [Ceraceosorus bombacis]|uniref:Eukaryotic translation initiation factor 4e class i n=1 Tax=Ceraceosorus bombacis TaxID=401625 RepID=A0A0P1BQX2_9BASI|nr:eukaryotic translation initiation factor 4e class i [Ceraceosorus bombacis]